MNQDDFGIILQLINEFGWPMALVALIYMGQIFLKPQVETIAQSAQEIRTQLEEELAKKEANNVRAVALVSESNRLTALAVEQVTATRSEVANLREEVRELRLDLARQSGKGGV